MKRFIRSKKAMAATGLATGLMLSAGIASAVVAFNWTTTGAGTGAAQAHVQTISLSGSTPLEDASLYPGNVTGSDVTFLLANSNAYAVTVTNVVAGAGSITSDKGAACDGTNVTFTPSLTNATGTTVPGNTSTPQLVTLKGNLSMIGTAANACQGAVFSIPLSVTETQSGS